MASALRLGSHMRTRQLLVGAVGAAAVIIFGAAVAISGTEDTRAAPAVGDVEGLGIAVDTYVYGYSLVTMEMTRKVMTNIAQPDGHHAPMGQFANMRTYPTSQFKDVTAPNADPLCRISCPACTQ